MANRIENPMNARDDDEEEAAEFSEMYYVYVDENGEDAQSEEVPVADVRKLVEAGEVKADTLVWAEGMDGPWVPLGESAELFGLRGALEPQPPAPEPEPEPGAAAASDDEPAAKKADPAAKEEGDEWGHLAELTDEAREAQGSAVRQQSYEACFDSFDLDNDGSLSISELNQAFQQLGMFLPPLELEQLTREYDADGNGELNKEEFCKMVDGYCHSSAQRWEAHDWCPFWLGPFALDCIKWGRRTTEMDHGELIVKGNAGPCGITKLSSELNVCIEIPKSKWMHVSIGYATLAPLWAYMWEAVVLFIVTTFMHAVLHRDSLSGFSEAAIIVFALWAAFRSAMFFRFRKATGTVFAVGNPLDASVPKGRFPLVADDATSAVDHFLHCKGVNLDETQSEASKKHPRRSFTRVFRSALCLREKHTLTVGLKYWRISKVPAETGSAGMCALMRKEFMAGQLSDVTWVHTARYGRDVYRLCSWILSALWWSFVVAMGLGVLGTPPCVDHPLCGDVEFAAKPVLSTGHCAAECFTTVCTNFTCGGSTTTCPHMNNGVCDEPFVCPAGTDTRDCSICHHEREDFLESGERLVYLATTNNSVCDEPYDCAVGTDALDCGREQGEELDANMTVCPWHNDGACDEAHTRSADGTTVTGSSGRCPRGSDFMDCMYASEADQLLADQRNFVLMLEDIYTLELEWISAVADLSIDACESKDPTTCIPQGCVDVTIIEKCSGCQVGANNSGTDANISAAQCGPSAAGYPNNTRLCNHAADARKIHKSEWCGADLHTDGVPCGCMTLIMKLAPDWDIFKVSFYVLSAISVCSVFAFWILYAPAWAEFGYPGMNQVTGKHLDHPGWFFTEPQARRRTDVTLTVLENKLGRAPSGNVIRSWEHAPLVRTLLTGYKETMIVRNDTITLSTQGGINPCCICCCRKATGDAEEYTILLQDVNFVEIGATLGAVPHALAMVFLTIALGLFFSSFITAGLFSSLRRDHDINRDGVISENEKGYDVEDIDFWKWAVFFSCLGLFVVFEFFAGLKKKGYVMVNVSPGGSPRGELNPFAGNSPFFIRLKPGHPDMNGKRFPEVIKLIRAAAAASKSKGPGDKKGIIRFRMAVRMVIGTIRFAKTSVKAGLEDVTDTEVADAKARAGLDDEKSQLQLSEGRTHCITEERTGLEHKIHEKGEFNDAHLNGQKDAEDGSKPAGKLMSLFRRTRANRAKSLQSEPSQAAIKADSKKGANEGSTKIFAEIDTDGSGAVSFDEFSQWLDEWVVRVLREAGDKDGADKAKKLHLGCKKAFDTVNTDGDDQLNLSEFQEFMAEGVIELFKEAGVWGAMVSSSMFDVKAIEDCFDKFDADSSGQMDVEELMDAFHELDKHPTAEEVDILLHVYDDDHSGTLEKAEFTRLMLQYVQNQRPRTEFEERHWCPINIFGLDFDFLPWGVQHTSMVGSEVISYGDAGLGGIAGLSNSNYSSIELAKTRWVHVMGNPAPLWKLNLYLGEALLIYSFLFAHPWFNVRGTFIGEHRTVLSQSLGVIWYLTRGFVFFYRTRGEVTCYCWGKPLAKPGQTPKCEFPVPISQLEEVTQAFMDIKGITVRDAAMAHAYRTKLPGYGCLPLSWKQCRGMHSVFFGSRHFKLEKVNGGGGSRVSRRFSRVDFMVGLITDVKWVHIYKRGKSMVRLFAGLLNGVVSGAMMVFPIVIGLSTTPKCRNDLNLRSSNLIPWNITETQSLPVDEWNVDQQIWCEQFSIDPKIKPGRPCVCPLKTRGPRVCNALLDPAAAETSHSDWCSAFEIAADHEHADLLPCECMTFSEQHAPDWDLFWTMWLCFVIPYSIGIFALWIFYTPVWGELGIAGVDATKKDHFARFRISPKYLYERVIQKQYAQGLLDKIQEMKDMLLKEGVHESAFADVGQLDRGVITALEINGSVDSLAGALFGVIDDDNSGFIDEKELQECNDKTNDNWVDAAHSDMLATLRGYRKTQRDLTKNSAPEFDDDLSAEDFVRQVEKKIDEAGLDLNLSLDAWDDDNMTFQNPLEVVEEYDIEKYAAVNPDDLMEHLSLTEEQCTMFKLGKEIQRNNQQLKELVAQHSVYHATAQDSAEARTTGKRRDADMAALKAANARMRKEVASLMTGTKIARLKYINMFTKYCDDNKMLYPVTSSFTRSPISMSIMERKLKRPLRHELLRQWLFRPALAYLIFGEKQELLLHHDYVSLRLRSGAPVCMCCWTLATNTDLYNILLRDVYFIETGFEARTSLMNAVVGIFFGGLLCTVLAMAIVQWTNEWSNTGDETAMQRDLRLVVNVGVLVSVVPGSIVGLLGIVGKLRRPYVHLGCSPGGGENGRKNSFGGTSPFHIQLRKGETVEEARKLADWVRGAAITSRQYDVTYAKKLARATSARARATRTDAVGLAVANAKAEGVGTEALAQEDTSAGDVVSSHLAGEAETAAVVALADLSPSMGIMTVLEHTAVLGAIAIFIVTQLEMEEQLGVDIH